MTPEVLPKGQFAKLIGVSPGRVSQYIRENKLTGAALVGEGHGQQINVRVAAAQLNVRLDIDQRLSANGINTNLDRALGEVPPLPLEASSAEGSADPLFPPQVDRIEDHIKRERLEALRRQARRELQEEAASQGRYVLADDAKQQLGRALALQMSWFEGVLGELAAAVCSQFSLSNRDVVHCLRTSLREARERSSASMQAQAEAMPKLIEDAALDDDDDAQLAD